jgi:hypothetical protein
MSSKTIENKEEICLNCGNGFEGNYCPECGQPVRDFNKPVSFIFYNFMGDFFSFDTRFLKTFKYLIIKPGFLTEEFFRGKRVRYAPPMRVFIFVSFLLFLLLQIFTNRGLQRPGFQPVPENRTTGKADSATNLIVPPDKIISEITVNETDKDQKISLNLGSFSQNGNLKANLDTIAKNLEEQLKTADNPRSRRQLMTLISMCRSPEQAITRILKYLSWTFFLLLPVFALILKIFYIRRNHYYMKHLVFSIHLHSFVFTLFTFITLLYFIFNRNLESVTSLLVLSIPLYLALALKRFYGQGYGKVIVKTIGITLIYNLVAIGIVIFAVLKALNF